MIDRHLITSEKIVALYIIAVDHFGLILLFPWQHME